MSVPEGARPPPPRWVCPASSARPGGPATPCSMACHPPPRTVTAPADTSQTASALAGTWASSATVTTTWPRPASRSATWPPLLGSRAENGSSRSRTGGSPTSAWMALARPRRRHRAAAQASPWEAKARAPRSRTASSRSSRCGPTRLVRRVSSSFRRVGPVSNERGSVLDQLRIPRLELLRRPPSLPLLQQAIALAKGPVVRGEDGLLERPERGNGLVHEPAPLRRIASHDIEVLRPEERRTDLPTKVALAPHRRPIDLHLVRPVPGDLHLDQHPAAGGLDLPSKVCRLGFPPNQGLGARSARGNQEE